MLWRKVRGSARARGEVRPGTVASSCVPPYARRLIPTNRFYTSAVQLLETGARLEVLALSGPKGHRTVYSILGLHVEALPGGGLKVSGAFGEETRVWEIAGTSRRSLTFANPPSDKTFGFELLLREGEPPETTLLILDGA